jgi:hypothetical protein
MQSLLDVYARWYNEHRSHQGLGGLTPNERASGDLPARELPRIEPRARYPILDDGSVRAHGVEIRIDVKRAAAAKQIVVVELDAA